MIKKNILITGGAGFIGINSAKYFSNLGWKVTVLDNFSRDGAKLNIRWLQENASIKIEVVDIRNQDELNRVIRETNASVLLHLAAQVAVTSSVLNPREDFEINALGTFNVLEAIRIYSPDIFLINASTNKVYGKMDDVETTERNNRYEYKNLIKGVSEQHQLDFHSPYGCSKGIADQYTIDYSRIYGLQTTTFRQSCIYGTRQFGIEDQGWVAWFSIAAVLEKQITIYGDGKQIRDVLHVNDLVRAYEAAINNIDLATGQAFNVGGGEVNTLSLLELLSYLEQELSIKIPLEWSDWRPGDQPVFVCDLSKIKKRLGWEPKISVQDGVKDLIEWVRENKKLFD
jgi:CDP-paratose 2-epimerase